MCGWHHEEIGLFDPTHKFVKSDPPIQLGGGTVWNPADFTKTVQRN
jgi:hypothetical protein